MNLRIKLKIGTVIRLLLLWLLLFPGYQTTIVRADDDTDAVPGQIIVQLQPGVTIDAINQTYNTVTLAELEPGKGVT